MTSTSYNLIGEIDSELLRNYPVSSLDSYGTPAYVTDDYTLYEFHRATHGKYQRLNPDDNFTRTFNAHNLWSDTSRLLDLTYKIGKFSNSSSVKYFLHHLELIDPELSHRLSQELQLVRKEHSTSKLPLGRKSSPIANIKNYVSKLRLDSTRSRAQLEATYRFVTTLRDNFYDEPSNTIKLSHHLDAHARIGSLTTHIPRDLITKLPITLRAAIREYSDLLNITTVGAAIYSCILDIGHCSVKISK